MRGHLSPTSPPDLYEMLHWYDITDWRIKETIFYCSWL